MPIIDYHCHLPPNQIASNKQFDNLSQIWLEGDQYKMRAMRANGVAEKYISGDAPDVEKFVKRGLKPYLMQLEIRSIIGHILNSKDTLVSHRF
jgi:glucuronate isomerase